jgi:hypothetical protein
MVEHLVLIKLKPGTTAEQREAMCRALRELGSQVPGIVEISCGDNFSDRNQGYDVGLAVKFADRAALDAYLTHPAHQSVVANFIQPIREGTIVVDYEI